MPQIPSSLSIIAFLGRMVFMSLRLKIFAFLCSKVAIFCFTLGITACNIRHSLTSVQTSYFVAFRSEQTPISLPFQQMPLRVARRFDNSSKIGIMC